MRTWNPIYSRVVMYIFWASVIALTVNALQMHQPTLKAAILPGKVVPHTVVLQEFHIQPDGTAIPSAKYTYAVRSDGSRASEITTSNSASPATERILAFSSGKQMYALSQRQLKSTMFDPAKYRAVTSLRDSGNDCLFSGLPLSEKVEGEEVIGGYRSMKLVNGAVAQWFAVDYACALVKERDEWPDGQISEKRLIVLIPGEPSPSLFENPAGSQEVPPSRLFPLGTRGSDSDAYYQSHRPPEAAVAPH